MAGNPAPVCCDLPEDIRWERPRTPSLTGLAGDAAKRALDIVMSSLGLFLLMPVFALIGILIKKDSPGPVFYKGPRMGRCGRRFWIRKFRTMYEHPQSYQGPRVTGRDDDRITPLGRWLRNTKINELPQLWNVLVGEMSLVGPRPEDPKLTETWPRELREEILSVRPGITSPASIVYRGEEDLLSGDNFLDGYLKDIVPDKLRLDQLYVRNRSFPQDVDIIFWTLTIFVPRLSGARIAEGYLFAGPLFRLFYRYLSWFLVDFLIALTAVSVCGIMWRCAGPLDWGAPSLGVLALLIALIFSGLNSAAGLNRIVWAQATAAEAVGLIFTSGLVTLSALVLNRLQGLYGWLPYPALPDTLIAAIGMLVQFGFVASRYRLRLITGAASGWLNWRESAKGLGERVLIIGDGDGCQIARWLFGRSSLRPAFSVVGLVSIQNPTLHGMTVQGCRILGGGGDLTALIRRHDVRIVVQTLPETQDCHTFADVCEREGIRLLLLDDLLGMVRRYLERPEIRTGQEWLGEDFLPDPIRDPVTGLPTRAVLQEKLHRLPAVPRRNGPGPAVMFVELQGGDAFQYGRFAEERLMRIAAERLARCVRGNDTLARYAAREFALLFENVPDRSVIESIGRRVLSLMSRPLDGIKAENGAAVGICFPMDAMTGNDILRNIEQCHERKEAVPVGSDDGTSIKEDPVECPPGLEMNSLSDAASDIRQGGSDECRSLF